MTKFNERIYQLRKEKNLTQEAIANELNVSRQTISNWETGTAQPTIDKAIELAQLYGVSIDELVAHVNYQKGSRSSVLDGLLNKIVTIYLNPEPDIFGEKRTTAIGNCLVVEVKPYSIKVITEEYQQKTEKLLFLKDILGFEWEDEQDD